MPLYKKGGGDMDKGTIIRTIVLVLALTNQFLVTAGYHPIPGTQELWGEILSSIFTIVATLTAWFKNNYVTYKGKRQHQVLVDHQLAK